ncbi:hypothetical protein D4764_04G0003470 [Takifugu flavidus]|uniref:Uncharacterized protein n=1 Tax=Takifugu flavidus TaxID=433684 RepID=A0A5C6N7D8_9TELE|nr:hypothetical protein D4764_04G0003470 [Takifugu flavidus]
MGTAEEHGRTCLTSPSRSECAQKSAFVTKINTKAITGANSLRGRGRHAALKHSRAVEVLRSRRANLPKSSMLAGNRFKEPDQNVSVDRSSSSWFSSPVAKL